MSGVNAALAAHLSSGAASVARCWALTRRDGVVMGFTDHDIALSFEGIAFAASSGLTASALHQGTGLAVDNAEAAGALSHAGLSETDIAAGRYDGAGIRIWLVNWRDVTARQVIFSGTLGEIRRGAGAFETELRGHAERLNLSHGRIYQGPCTAILGDQACGFDLNQAGYHAQTGLQDLDGTARLSFGDLGGFANGWFARGSLEVTSGVAQGALFLIKSDVIEQDDRVITLWQELPEGVVDGDLVTLRAGCDKTADACRLKFINFNNFRGFPHIPGDDWLMAYPKSTDINDGGSLTDRSGA